MRFLALQVAGDQCPVQYDGETGRFAVPAAWRWPELYERSLVLASGRLPKRRDEWIIYESVSCRLVELLTPKLSLSVTRYEDE